MKIQVQRPYFPKAMRKHILKNLDQCFKNGWIGQGAKVQELEEKWAKFTGAKYAVATNSCTAALDIAVRIVDLPETVRVSAFTFVSSALAPLNAGHKIEFIDIDENSLCTKEADIQVMYAGNLFGKGKIYDMAHAGGAKHLGQVSCWSFHAVKNLPAGDGGMLTTNSKKLYEKAKALSWCGINKSTWQRSGKKYAWDYQITGQGLKAHMNDITATIALEQLKYLTAGNAYRTLIADTYTKYLPQWIKRPFKSSTWHLYTIRVPDRDKLFDFLAEHGVGCGVHYKPLTNYGIFGFYEELPVTDQVFKEIITLPCHLQLKLSEVKKICKLIDQFYGHSIPDQN